MLPEGLEYPDQPVCPKVGFACHQDVLQKTIVDKLDTDKILCVPYKLDMIGA